MAELELWLIDLLRCPTCGQAMVEIPDQLRCSSGHDFPVIGGVPVLLPRDESTEVAAQHLHQREFYDQVFQGEGAYRLEL